MANRTPHVVDINDVPLVNWTHEPAFEFVDEVSALQMLQMLGEELQSAREHERHCMRYLAIAIQAAQEVREDGKKIQPQAIINHSGLARQTVYDILSEAE